MKGITIRCKLSNRFSDLNDTLLVIKDEQGRVKIENVALEGFEIRIFEVIFFAQVARIQEVKNGPKLHEIILPLNIQRITWIGVPVKIKRWDAFKFFSCFDNFVLLFLMQWPSSSTKKK